MRNRRNLLVAILISVVSMVGLLSVGKAEARKGGLPLCLEDLATCQTDLEACEAAPCAVFPGDGVTGPALSYTDNGDGTFTDNNTHLVWEKKNNVDGSVHNVENTYEWSESGTAADGDLFTTFLATLNTAPCFAGHCDWRIPNVKELQSLVNYSTLNPATSVPGASAADIYWSSTSDTNFPLSAWGVFFYDGHVFLVHKRSIPHARAVRGGS
jgi:Protein of unknown function (DUF1566)